MGDFRPPVYNVKTKLMTKVCTVVIARWADSCRKIRHTIHAYCVIVVSSVMILDKASAPIVLLVGTKIGLENLPAPCAKEVNIRVRDRSRVCLCRWGFTQTIAWTFLGDAGLKANALPVRFATARRYYLYLVHLAVHRSAGHICALFAPLGRRGKVVYVWSVWEIRLRSRQVWWHVLPANSTKSQRHENHFASLV